MLRKVSPGIKNHPVRITRAQAILLIAFILFILMRSVPWPNWLPVPAKYADADLYIRAGQALIRGALPDSVNQEHPPLAKYIIGFFSVYLNNPYGSAFVFGLLTAIVAFLIAYRLTEDLQWAALTVWILAFDQVNISLSIRPMLDIFMIFFAIIGFYLVMTASEKMFQYIVAGLSLGFALACKLNAALFLIPVLVVIVWEHKLKEMTGLLASAATGYVASYFQLLLSKGFSGLLSTQVSMLSFQLALHAYGAPVNLLLRAMTPLLVHTTTLAATGYGEYCPPNLLGLPFSTIAETVNAPLLLLPFPLLFWLLRQRGTSPPQMLRAIHLLILTIIGCMIYESVFPFTIGAWYFAPMGTVLAIGAPAMLVNLQRSNVSRYSTYILLAILTAWLAIANAIYMACGVA